MSQAIAQFADEMLQHFPPFRKWEEYQEKAWADTLATELAGFSSEVLTAAKKQIIRTRKPHMPRPPMVSECIDACVEARRFIEKDKRAGEMPEINKSAGAAYSPEREALASSLIRSAMGREAAQAGPCWILSLWEFCRDNQRLPVGPEIARCQRAAREVEDALTICRKEVDVSATFKPVDGWLPLAGPADFKLWQRTGINMLAKREKLSAEVLGKPDSPRTS